MLAVPESTVEKRLVVGTSLGACLYSLVGAVSNHWLGDTGPLTASCLAAAFAFGVVAYQAYRGSDTAACAWGFVIVAFGFLSITWEPNGGIRGSTPILFPVLVTFAILASPARLAWAVTSGVLGLFGTLVAFEFRDGAAADSPFTTSGDAADATITGLLAISLSALAVVGTRTAYLRERERLRYATRRAEDAAARAAAADAAKTAFLARMSHDLRTPLAAVVGSLDVVAADPGRADATRLLVGARDRCAELQRVMGALLELELGDAPPDAAIASTAPRVSTDAGSAVHRAAASIEGLRVLFADDEPVMRTTLDAMLDALGCVPTTVADGAAAVEAVRTGAFDVVLLDVNMPVLDGLGAARAIRAMQPALPLVAVSANAYPADVAACAAAGMAQFVAKPLTLSQLDAALRRAIASRGD